MNRNRRPPSGSKCVPFQLPYHVMQCLCPIYHLCVNTNNTGLETIYCNIVSRNPCKYCISRFFLIHSQYGIPFRSNVKYWAWAHIRLTNKAPWQHCITWSISWARFFVFFYWSTHRRHLFKWMKGLRFFTQCCCLFERPLKSKNEDRDEERKKKGQ